MRTIEQIKERRAKGLKKWGADIYDICKDKFDTSLTALEILDFLNAPPYEFGLKIFDLKNIKSRYHKKKVAPSNGGDATYIPTPSINTNLTENMNDTVQEINSTKDISMPVFKNMKPTQSITVKGGDF